MGSQVTFTYALQAAISSSSVHILLLVPRSSSFTGTGWFLLASAAAVFFLAAATCLALGFLLGGDFFFLFFLPDAFVGRGGIFLFCLAARLGEDLVTTIAEIKAILLLLRQLLLFVVVVVVVVDTRNTLFASHSIFVHSRFRSPIGNEHVVLRKWVMGQNI